jgi:Transposase DNA-binding/Transposase DDE domain
MKDAAERAEAVIEDLSDVELGDSRLDFRARQIARRIATKPAVGFPDALVTSAELEGLYRFLGNEKVSAAALLKPHSEATIGRAVEHGTALAIHDTTVFRFGGRGREGLGELTRAGDMFLAHFCLAVSADGSRDPLGVLGTKTWARDGSPTRTKLIKQGVKASSIRGMPTEQSRWREMVEEVEKKNAGRASLIHVMDSEPDDYALLCFLQQEGHRFVLRSTSDRKLDATATGCQPGEKTRQFMARAEAVAEREVKLSRRGRGIAGGGSKRTMARNERMATLLFSGTTLVFCRPTSALKELPDTVSVNMVFVREKDPPDGTEPVEWFLLTSEPIDTTEQLLSVVDIYRARWLIEEYFSALKTGCAFEERQLESIATLTKALALFTPVAWVLLRMRASSRSPKETSIATVLTPTQIIILKKETKLPLDSKSTAADAYIAVARLGGHIKNNGPPGWRVLRRGYDTLITLEAGYKIAQSTTCDR